MHYMLKTPLSPHCYQKSSIFDAKRVPNGVSQNMGLFLHFVTSVVKSRQCWRNFEKDVLSVLLSTIKNVSTAADVA